jgi:hypothetical protein
MVVRIVQELK